MDPKRKTQFDELVAAAGYDTRNALAKALSQSLSPEEIGELVSLSVEGSEAERDGAIRVLKELDSLRPDAFPPKERASWLDSLAANTRQEYPHSVLGRLSYVTLLGRDRQRAEKFLIELSLEGLRDADLQRVARDLSHISSNPKAIDRLRTIATMSGAAARSASDRLESKGVMTPERLAELAGAWREQRSPQALSDFYYKYIANIPAGDFPVARIIELLGPPTGQSKNAVWYVASSGTALYLESDEKGNLTAFRLS